MKKIHFKIVLLTLFVSVLSSCHEWLEGCKYGVEMKNTSTSEMYALYRYKHEYIRDNHLTLDSSMYEKNQIPVGDKKTVLYVSGFNSDEFWKSTDTISIFVFLKEEFEGKTWTQLVDSGKSLQVYHLSGDDIRRLGSCVPFPPTGAVCDMVIDPSCGE